MTYCITDIETTGGNAATGGITEISIYKHDGEKVVDHFTTLINPMRAIPSFVVSLTGITNEMVKDAPVFEDVAEQVYNFLQGSVFVAHSVNFDHSFIKYELQKAGYDLQVKKLCTIRLARKAFPNAEGYSLGTLCRTLKIPITGRHRADGDAKATTHLFELVLKSVGLTLINEMLKRDSAEQWLPQYLDREVVDKLPKTAGVYYFHNAKGKVIYVGKAINLKKRVAGHFTNFNPEERRQHFLRQITNITFKECANELHALVLESTEIKRLWPKYNYSQKEPLIKFGLYSYYDNRGYLHLALDKKKKTLPAIFIFNLYEDGRRMLRNMVEECGLNAKFCHLDENTVTDEDLADMGSPSVYNKKVETALQRFLEAQPSFALFEGVPGKPETVCLLVERGSFWGMGHLPRGKKITCINELKDIIQPYTDNNFIRHSLLNYASLNPHKVKSF